MCFLPLSFTFRTGSVTKNAFCNSPKPVCASRSFLLRGQVPAEHPHEVPSSGGPGELSLGNLTDQFRIGVPSPVCSCPQIPFYRSTAAAAPERHCRVQPFGQHLQLLWLLPTDGYGHCSDMIAALCWVNSKLIQYVIQVAQSVPSSSLSYNYNEGKAFFNMSVNIRVPSTKFFENGQNPPAGCRKSLGCVL